MSTLDDPNFIQQGQQSMQFPDGAVQPQKRANFPPAEILLWSGQSIVLPSEWKNAWKTVPWIGLFFGLPLFGFAFLIVYRNLEADLGALIVWSLLGVLIAIIGILTTLLPILFFKVVEHMRCAADAQYFYVRHHPKRSVKAYDWTLLSPIEYTAFSSSSMDLFYRYNKRVGNNDPILLPKSLAYRLEGDAETFAQLQALQQAAKTAVA